MVDTAVFVCVYIFFIFLSISLCGMFALDGLGGGMTGFRGCSFFVVTCVLWLLNIFRINGIISCESFLHISILALERGAAAFSADRFSMSECERERERMVKAHHRQAVLNLSFTESTSFIVCYWLVSNVHDSFQAGLCFCFRSAFSV